MFPSLPNPSHDPRWDFSGWTAFLTTLILNLGLVLGLFLMHTTSAVPAVSPVLRLEFKALPVIDPSVPAKIPVVNSKVAEVVHESPPVEVPTKPEIKPRSIQEEPQKKTQVEPEVQPTIPKQSSLESDMPVDQPLETQSSSLSDLPVAPLSSTTNSKTKVAEITANDTTDMALVLSALAQLIERHKDYPKAARRAGYEGVVVVKVAMDKEGVIIGWTMEQGSAHAVLDRAAEKTFARLVGQKIHNSSSQAGLSIVVPVRYELRHQG